MDLVFCLVCYRIMNLMKTITCTVLLVREIIEMAGFGKCPFTCTFRNEGKMGWRGRAGSIGRALASISNGFHDQRFKSRPEHKKTL